MLFRSEFALAQTSEDTEAEIKHFKAGAALYQGPFLAKINQSWVLTQREQFEHQFIEGSLKLANLLMQQGHNNSALQYCKRVLDQDSCNEAAYRLIMLTYAAMEDRAAVKKTFETCRITLENELGIEPNETTRNLLETLLS